MITIPQHGKREVSPRTRNIILDQLEEDVFRWETKLEQKTDQEDDERGFENGQDRY